MKVTITDGDVVSLLIYIRDMGHTPTCLISTSGLAKQCDCGIWDLAKTLVDAREAARTT